MNKLKKLDINNEFRFPVCGEIVEWFDICENCGWQNTGLDNIDGGPNKMTLEEATMAYKNGKIIY